MAGFKSLLAGLVGTQKAPALPTIPALPTSADSMNDAQLLARLRARQRDASRSATPATLLTGWQGGAPTPAQGAAMNPATMVQAPTKTLLGQ